jgi:hypothetical protein
MAYSLNIYPSSGSHSTPLGESLESCLLTMTPSSPLTAHTIPFPDDTYPSSGSHSTPVGESLESCLLTMTPSSPLTAHTMPFPDDICNSSQIRRKLNFFCVCKKMKILPTNVAECVFFMNVWD